MPNRIPAARRLPESAVIGVLALTARWLLGHRSRWPRRANRRATIAVSAATRGVMRIMPSGRLYMGRSYKRHVIHA